MAAKFPRVVGGKIVASGQAAFAKASSLKEGKTMGSTPFAQQRSHQFVEMFPVFGFTLMFAAGDRG